MPTLPPVGVRIVAHFNWNAYMHERATIGFGVRIGQEVPKLEYAFWSLQPVNYTCRNPRTIGYSILHLLMIYTK